MAVFEAFKELEQQKELPRPGKSSGGAAASPVCSSKSDSPPVPPSFRTHPRNLLALFPAFTPLSHPSLQLALGFCFAIAIISICIYVVSSDVEHFLVQVVATCVYFSGMSIQISCPFKKLFLDNFVHVCRGCWSTHPPLSLTHLPISPAPPNKSYCYFVYCFVLLLFRDALSLAMAPA